MKKKLYSFLLVAFLATTWQFAFADITSGLRINYTFDQIDSTEAKVPYFADQSGNHMDGIIEGNIPLVASYTATGKAIALVDTDKVVRTPANMFEGVTNFTVSLWINQNTNIKWARFFDFGSNKDHYMFLCTDGDVGDFLRFEIDYDKNPANENDDAMLTYLKATRALTIKKWNHVAVTGEYTISGTDTLSTIKIYINGMLSATATNKFKIAPYMLGNNLTHPYFGDSQWPDPNPNSNVDDFRFYTRALTESDIEELSGVSAAQKTAWAGLDIPAASRTNMEKGSTLTLPTTLGDGAFDVNWSTSDSTVIKKTGVPQHGDIAVTDAILTAAISPAGKLYPMLEKDFFVSVYPLQEPITDIAWMDFVSDSIVRRNDSIYVKDGGEVGFTAYTVGGAQILPIGDESGDEGIDYFNVYVSDNRATSSANKQWLELGPKIGTFMYKLRDHSISLFYRRDSTIDHKTWSDQGQLLWAFSNAKNLNSWGGTGSAQPWGAMYFEPDQTTVAIIEGNAERSAFDKSTGELNSLKWGTGKTPIGNAWHNICYTQNVGIGYLLVDGVQVATGPMPAPKVQLKKNSNVATFTGTPYNRLGGEMHTNRITAKNTMLWGFRVISFGMPAEECDDYFFITDNLAALNTAMQNTTYSIPNYLAILPTMADARNTLKIGFKTAIHTQLLADYAVAQADSAARDVKKATIDSLTKRIAQYKEKSADWVKMGTVLKSFGDERALNYPGLPALEEAIQAAQDAYDNYAIETELFTYLDDATLTYLKSQVAASNKPANYTFYIKNAGFEDATTGGIKTGTSTGGQYDVPKGWSLRIDGKGWTGSKFGTDHPAEGTRDYEVWTDYNAGNRVYTWDLSHVIAEPLPAGWYVLSADVRGPGGAGDRGGAHIYAFSLTDSVTLKSDTLESPRAATPWEGGYSWTYEAYKKVFVKFHSDGEKYKVGFHVDSSYFKMDNMKLAYFGASAEEPVLGDVTSYLKNAGFESGARTAELEGFDAATNLTAAAGDVFAPKDWTVLATAKAPSANATINVLASGASEGSNLYRLKADTLTSVKLVQTIFAPSSGMYKLNAMVRSDSAYKSDARLFAKVGTRQWQGKTLKIAVDSVKSFTGWKKMEYTFRAAVADQIDLGLLSSANIDVDNFTLENYANVAVGIKGNKEVGTTTFKPYAKDGVIYIPNVTSADRVSVYDIAGRQISVKNPQQIKVSKGMYVIKINNEVIKQLVK